MATNISFGNYTPPDKTEKEIKEMTLAVLFDGTLNNQRNTYIRKEKEKKKKGVSYDKDAVKDDPWGVDKDSYDNDYSNVARIQEFYSLGKDKALYIEGIGTLDGDTDTLAGYLTGTGETGIRAKVRSGCEKVFNEVSKLKGAKVNLVLDVFGFSRGSAAARAFVNEVTKGAYTASKVWDSEKEKWNYYDLDSKKVEKEQLPKRGHLGVLCEKNEIEINTVKIRFVGLYDTVSSYGVNFEDDATGKDDVREINLKAISDSAVKNVVQIAAGHEWRKNFNLTNINSAGTKGIQYLLPGCHCDIGGAYENGSFEQDHFVKMDKDGRDAAMKYGFASKQFEPFKEKYKKELVESGWYKPDQLKFVMVTDDYNIMYKGTRYIDQRYSFLSLHFMSGFAKEKEAGFDIDGIKKKFKIPEKAGDKEHILGYVKKKLEAYIEAVKNTEDYKRSTLSYKKYLDFANEKTLINTNLHWSATDKTGHGPRANQIRKIIDG
ncbi:putative alpha/beta hydrolase family protein DUF2235 [Flavobacterium araucananum]|uniref:T6SS Phospholipase effector Tle1-like catalytic domain-containing protein n=1 Tax=Flavobacterium araucananum TaxID=946678 RepID=A0A227PCV1_9FLAO|nr:DUF2235 domain-containing protein [Flavobacterium araucananum]OXG07730.1 hypothetical protein B0A64_07720 [Flavobacterium araucananum]PWK02091.1 putative alpha/beta hydrolase family protein DUF2235 [Flavobacterium araucananum]